MPAKKKQNKPKKQTSGKKPKSSEAELFQKKLTSAKKKPFKSTSQSQKLDEARQLYFQNRFNEVISLLRKTPEKNIFDDKISTLEYYRLMSFSLTNEGEYNKAHDITLLALELDDNDRDFYFVQTFIAISFKDYEP